MRPITYRDSTAKKYFITHTSNIIIGINNEGIHIIKDRYNSPELDFKFAEGFVEAITRMCEYLTTGNKTFDKMFVNEVKETLIDIFRKHKVKFRGY